MKKKIYTLCDSNPRKGVSKAASKPRYSYMIKLIIMNSTLDPWRLQDHVLESTTPQTGITVDFLIRL